MKARNLVLSIVFCALLAGPAALFLGQERLHLDLPGWLTSEDADYLAGGLERAQVGKHLSLEGFTSEELQSNLETSVGNHIPLKASALLGNASLQRCAIALSNGLFGFEAVPTYFGSERLYLPEHDALARMPEQKRADIISGTRATAEGFAKLARYYPDKQFCIIVGDESGTSKANPAARLVSDPASTQDCIDALTAALSSIENVRVVCVPYEKTNLYYQDYYTTDHHWNGYGTLAVYKEVCAAMGYQSTLDNDQGTIKFPGLAANGSLAREGLMFLNETIEEPQFDLSGIEVHSKRDLAPIVSEDPVLRLFECGRKAEFTFYSSWYGSYQLAAASPITNTRATNSSTAIVIQDSFNNSLHWLLAQNHQHLKCFSDTKPSKERHSLQERIESTNADTIYLVGNVSAVRRLTDEQPDYFELSDNIS